MYGSQSLRKSGQFFHHSRGRKIKCRIRRNPFVSQVNSFAIDGTSEKDAAYDASQSLRKSGQFFQKRRKKMKDRIVFLCRNPFVSQVNSFSELRPDRHLAWRSVGRNPFVSQVNSFRGNEFFWKDFWRGLGRNPFVSQVNSFNELVKEKEIELNR